MKRFRKYNVELEHKTYVFYDEIAKLLRRSIEDVLSDTLYKYADIAIKDANRGSYQ